MKNGRIIQKGKFLGHCKKMVIKGWEIAMHGYNIFTRNQKKDFFGYGGKSEFYGHT